MASTILYSTDMEDKMSNVRETENWPPPIPELTKEQLEEEAERREEIKRKEAQKDCKFFSVKSDLLNLHIKTLMEE